MSRYSGSPQGIMDSERMKKATMQEFFGTKERGMFYVAMLDQQQTALIAAGVGLGPRDLLRVLYVFARMSIHNHRRIRNFEVATYPKQETLAARMGVTVKSVQNYLKVLESIGACRRERQGSNINRTFVLAPTKLLFNLLSDEAVLARARVMDPKGIQALLAEHPLEAVDDVEGVAPVEEPELALSVTGQAELACSNGDFV